MKLIFLWILCLCCSASSLPRVYYITPHIVTRGTCIVNGAILTPCYTLPQLIDDEILSSSNESSVALVLLPGTHVIPETLTFNGSNLFELVIRPWNEQQEVVIECQVEANLIFQGFAELKLLSLHFSFCILQFLKFKTSVITTSIFVSSETDYSVFLESERILMLLFQIAHFCRLIMGQYIYMEIPTLPIS